MSKANKIIIAVALILIGLTWIRGCNKEKQYSKAIVELSEYEHKVEYYKAKNGKLVAYNTSLETTMEALEDTNDTLVDYLKNIKIKKPEVIIITDTKVRIDSMFIPVEVPCDTVFTSPFLSEDSTHRISGKLTERGITLDEISFPNRSTIVVGTKRIGLFKKETIVTVNNSNPHMQVSGITSYTFPEKKWYQKTGPKILIGAITGATATYFIMR